jgi:SOS-response transcriptional repressor LexA
MGTRLRTARRQAGYTQDQVAVAVGKSRPLVSLWESGGANPAPDDWEVMARLYNVSIDFLMTGIHARKLSIAGNVSSAITRQIPLIDYVNAGKWGDVNNPFEKGDGFDFVPADASVSDAAFALRVEGDSMSPEFRPGSIIIVDPGVAPNPGDMVVAKLDRDETATFKKFRPRGVGKGGKEVIELVPINPDWPTLVMDGGNPGRIIGTVVSHLRKMR